MPRSGGRCVLYVCCMCIALRTWGLRGCASGPNIRTTCMLYMLHMYVYCSAYLGAQGVRIRPEWVPVVEGREGRGVAREGCLGEHHGCKQGVYFVCCFCWFFVGLLFSEVLLFVGGASWLQEVVGACLECRWWWLCARACRRCTLVHTPQAWRLARTHTLTHHTPCHTHSATGVY